VALPNTLATGFKNLVPGMTPNHRNPPTAYRQLLKLEKSSPVNQSSGNETRVFPEPFLTVIL